jgi:hypothetical protein
MLFLLLAWKRSPMTSALYPYVHTQACGMSAARYSSGQKTVAGGGDDAGPEGGCACSALVDSDLAVRRLNKDFRPLGFLVVLLLPLLALVVVATVVAAASQVPRG